VTHPVGYMITYPLPLLSPSLLFFLSSSIYQRHISFIHLH
jgi:hypothetical protein